MRGQGYVVISITEQTPISTFKGFIDAMGKAVTTPFEDAYTTGKICIIDEFDAGDPNTTLEINSAISNGVYTFASGQKTMHPDFRMIATANTFGNGANQRFNGRNKMDEATVKRFIPMVWELDEKLEDAIVQFPEWLKVVRAARAICREELDNQVIGQRESIYGAKMLKAGQPFERVFQSMILNGKSEDDAITLSRARFEWSYVPDNNTDTDTDDSVEVVEVDPDEIDETGELMNDLDALNVGEWE